MIEFRLPAGGPASGPVWSQTTLGPLAPGALTPFSYSMLAEIAGRAWYLYFDRLGFEPTPRTRLVQQQAGRPYVNISASAELEARRAGLQPVALTVNDTPYPLAAWEKPGFLAAMGLSRSARKIGDTLDALQDELPALTARSQSWLQRVNGLRWSQAEVLQIMEEIERVGSANLLHFFAARHNLEQAYYRLLALVSASSLAQRMALVNQALATVADTVEMQMARQVVTLAAAATREPAALAWLRKLAGAPPLGAFGDQWTAFLQTHGHRALDEGELSQPRWAEDPVPVQQAVLAAVDAGATAWPTPKPDGEATLLAAVDGKQRKEAASLLAQLRRWLVQQSSALDAYAYHMAGTRRWALAAAREAMVDQRLEQQDDVFFFELEEMKEMMTGEWNVSDRAGIHETAAQRRAGWASWRQSTPGCMWLGEQEMVLAVNPLPGAPGEAQGTLAFVPRVGAILGSVQPGSGWAVTLPSAAGLVVAQGSPLDPAVVTAAALGKPVVIALGASFWSLRPGQTAALDGTNGRLSHG